MTHPGQVLNRAAQDLPHDTYDFVVVGGGLLGTACARFLRELAPERSLLLVEASGIPSEEGATHVAPALHHHDFADTEQRARARWCSELLRRVHAERGTRGAHSPVFARVGLLCRLDDSFAGHQGAIPFALWRAAQPDSVRANVAELFGFADDEPVRFDPAGGYGNAEELALHFGRAAVAAGADLLLNARAAFEDATSLRFDRLEWDNRMELKIVRQTRVRASAVVLACGAGSASLLAAGLGVAAPFGRAFVQCPRFENDRDLRRDTRGVTAMPVVVAHGFAIRPHGDGALLVPVAPLPPDPPDYAPTGGTFHGVSVGLRAELLDQVAAALDRLPALARPSLNLGKTPANLRGAWEVVTPSGLPEIWPAPGAPVWLLAGGGAHGFSLGVAAARELAHRLSGTDAPMPWSKDDGAPAN